MSGLIEEKQTIARFKRHKWGIEDTCERCGLERRGRALTKNLRHYGSGNFLYDYLVDGKWGENRPECSEKPTTNTLNDER